ncbi:hypothetical protein RchiOBHm_Chr2g0136151 [Rosa chinensis]|uniref:Uncharacterized protein n=1 Tax=Rosa chinensis TaxID=74649 RepID=A0A2P6RW95_ROSCH|nr:hypothetical protein RchiOBHm_Chr2g0136151 [Rosa chinensis]
MPYYWCVRKIMFDVVEESKPFRKYGVSALLYYAMTGTLTRFHSRAKQVLLLLMDNSTLGTFVCFLRDCPRSWTLKELKLMFECLYQEIKGCVINGDVLHLSRLLSLLVSTVQVKNGTTVSDYKQMLEIGVLLVQTYIIHSGIQLGEEHLSEVVDKIFQLMLSILSGLHTYNDLSTISGCSLQWAPVFDLQKSSLLGFIQQLLQKDISIIDTFRVNILRAMNVLIETSEEDVIYLLLIFCERVQMGVQSFKLLDGSPELSRIQCFLSGTVSNWVGLLNGVENGDLSSTSIHEADLALLWGSINCFLQIVDSQEGPSLLFDLTDAIDQPLMIEDDMAMDALKMFADKMCHSDGGIRASTIRILCHFGTLSCDIEPVLKKMKTELSPSSHVDNKDFNVIQLLLSIESTPLSISTSRKVTLLISRIQMGLSAGKISEAYLPLVVNGMIGIFHNRFSHLRNPVSECLAVLISQSNGLVWENFHNYFEQCQSVFQASIDQVGQVDTVLSNKSSGIISQLYCFKLTLLPLLWMFPLMPYLHVQVLELLVEVEFMKKRFHKHISSVLQVTKSILQSAIDAVTHDSPHETAIPFWKEAFYSLVMLEKILNQFHDLSFDKDLEVCRITL